MTELTPVQEKVIRNKKRYKVLNFGRRSGKTTVMAYEAQGTALTIDNAQVTYYAQTFGDARDIAWKIFLEVFGGAVVKKNESLLEFTVKNLKGGTSKVSLKGWESVVIGGKGRGTENDLLLMDEVAFCRNFMEKWDTVLAPTLLTSKGRALFASTPDGFNWFYELTQRATTTEEWAYFHATSYDNPYNDPVELDRIRAEIGDQRFGQEYEANFTKKEGLVYAQFNRETHVKRPESTDEMQKMLGVDFGHRDPTAALTVWKDGTGSYWVTDEIYRSGMIESEVVEAVKPIEALTYPDPADASKIEAMRRAGIRLRDVTKEAGSINSGIEKIQELLLAKKLFISPTCLNTIRELETYSWHKDKTNQPMDENNHALDALRYVIFMTYFNKAKIETKKQPYNPNRRSHRDKDYYDDYEEEDDTPLWMQK